MRAKELKEYCLKQDFEKINVHFKEMAHQSFLKGWFKAWGWTLLPKKWLLKWAEQDWQKVEYLFDLNTPIEKVALVSDNKTKS